MANLTSVGVTAGVPTSGTGTVSTVDNIPALWDKGLGTGGALTQRIIIDGSQVSPLGQATMLSSSPVVIAKDQDRPNKADAILTLTTTTETTVIAAIAATFNDVYGVIIANTSATACNVSFRDVTAGTVRFQVMVPAGDTRGFMLPNTGAFKQTTVNTAWTAQCSTGVTSIIVTMLYIKN